MKQVIDVHPGTHLGVGTLSSATDPAGFREKLGFSLTHINALCDLVRELIDELLIGVPAALCQHVEERLQDLPLYAHTAPGRFATMSRNIHFQLTGLSPRGVITSKPVAVPPFSIDGLLLSATPDKILAKDPSFLSAAFHELVHAVVHDALAMDNAMNEAVALRFQHEMHPYPGFYATQSPWDPAQFQGTTGFRTADMASWHRSKGATRAWYIATAHALDSVPSQALWNICTGLSQYSRTPRITTRAFECVLPMQADIRQAFESELGKQKADAVFQTIGLSPMIPGSHTLRFPQMGSTVEEFRFLLQQNPAYGELNQQSHWNGIQYHAADMP